MPSYFISPPDDTDWSLAPEEFEARLRERWPDAEIRPAPEGSPMAFHFTIDVGGESLDGAYAADGQTLWIEMGSEDQMAQLAVWFRGLVPEDEELDFADEGLEVEMRLDPSITPEQFLERFAAA
jgi:hypothetical protein